MTYDALYTITLRKILEKLEFKAIGLTYLEGDQIVYKHSNRGPKDIRYAYIILPKNTPVLPKPMVGKIFEQIKNHGYSEKEIQNAISNKS